MNTRVGVVATVILALSALSLSGCTSAPPPGDDIAVEIYQTRPDQGDRRLEISVTNTSDEPMTITRVEFASTQFAEPTAWQKDSTRVGAQLTVDLPVQLPAADCGDGAITATVTIDYAIGDGPTQTVEVSPVDRNLRMEALKVEDCLGVQLADHVEVAIATLPRVVTKHGRTVAELDVRLSPTGAHGSVSIDAALSTVLLSVADPGSGQNAASFPLGVTVDARSEPRTVTLELVPARCDPHAVAEDKRGTIMPFSITLADGTSGTVFIPASPEVKAALLDFVGVACGS